MDNPEISLYVRQTEELVWRNIGRRHIVRYIYICVYVYVCVYVIVYVCVCWGYCVRIYTVIIYTITNSPIYIIYTPNTHLIHTNTPNIHTIFPLYKTSFEIHKIPVV